MASGYTGQCGQCVQRVWTISLRMFHQLVEHCRCKTLRIGHPAPENAATFCCWCYHFHCTAQAKFTCHSCIMLHHAASWQEGTAKPRGHADLKSDYLLLKPVLGFGNKDLPRLQRCWSTEDAGSLCYLSWKTSRKNYQISSNYKGVFSSQCVCAVLRMRLTCQVFCLISAAGNMFACLILSVSLWFSFPGMSRVKVPATWLYRIRQNKSSLCLGGEHVQACNPQLTIMPRSAQFACKFDITASNSWLLRSMRVTNLSWHE